MSSNAKVFTVILMSNLFLKAACRQLQGNSFIAFPLMNELGLTLQLIATILVLIDYGKCVLSS